MQTTMKGGIPTLEIKKWLYDGRLSYHQVQLPDGTWRDILDVKPSTGMPQIYAGLRPAGKADCSFTINVPEVEDAK